MKKALLGAAFLGAAIVLSGPVAAQQVAMAFPGQPLVMLTGKTPESSKRHEIVRRVYGMLAEIGAPQITDVAADGLRPVRWRWVILNESEWLTTLRIYEARSPLAFGSLRQRVTYLRGLRVAPMSSLELKRLLAHELGHLICACADQSRADNAADAILKKHSVLRAAGQIGKGDGGRD